MGTIKEKCRQPNSEENKYKMEKEKACSIVDETSKNMAKMAKRFVFLQKIKVERTEKENEKGGNMAEL